jgi:GNAT superfamily N-acetyltransferase
VSRPDIVPFSDEHLDGAARLLEARHRRHRKAEPLLPDDVDFCAEIEREWREDGSNGVAAVAGDEVVGYLIGRRREDRFGASLWSFVAGHASTDAELTRDLYAAAASRWVADGLTKHFVFVPAFQDLIDPWFRLSFGASAALAIRETGAEPVNVPGVVIREGTEDDLEAAARLDRSMLEHMLHEPSFSGIELPSDDEYHDDWRGTWDDPVYKHFVAERDARIVGHILLYRRPPDLRVPKDSIDLAAASTDPTVRGSGVGVALTHHVLAWAKDNGIPTMITDWRMTNLLASRFLPARDFRPAFLRLYRSIP